MSPKVKDALWGLIGVPVISALIVFSFLGWVDVQPKDLFQEQTHGQGLDPK